MKYEIIRKYISKYNLVDNFLLNKTTQKKLQTTQFFSPLIEPIPNYVQYANMPNIKLYEFVSNMTNSAKSQFLQIYRIIFMLFITNTNVILLSLSLYNERGKRAQRNVPTEIGPLVSSHCAICVSFWEISTPPLTRAMARVLDNKVEIRFNSTEGSVFKG